MRLRSLLDLLLGATPFRRRLGRSLSGPLLIPQAGLRLRAGLTRPGGIIRNALLACALASAVAGCAAEPQSAPAGSALALPTGQSPESAIGGQGSTNPTPSGLDSAPGFESDVRGLTAAERKAMVPAVWRPGCPVPLGELRMVEVRRWTADGEVARGRLVVNKDSADAVVHIMQGLFAVKFPIQRMVPIERYGGDDFRSIEANNTSAFNCRRAFGFDRWSEHSFGRAIDINPLVNPYVSAGNTSHPRSRAYLRRTPVRPGMLVPGSPALAVVRHEGWGWGGDGLAGDKGPGKIKDYQHISATDR